MAGTMNQPSLTGSASIDLGLGQQLTTQVQEDIEARKKKASQLANQRQMFPATGMLLGMGATTSGGAI